MTALLAWTPIIEKLQIYYNSAPLEVWVDYKNFAIVNSGRYRKPGIEID
jgi:hypothetical protein